MVRRGLVAAHGEDVAAQRRARASGRPLFALSTAVLADMRFDGPTGPMRMRASDHQLLHPLFVSVFTDENITNDSENTGLGWKTILKVDGERLSDDSGCQVEKP